MGKLHPEQMERVTVASVTAALDAVGCRVTAVIPRREGVVRIVISGWTKPRRRAAQRAVLDALHPTKRAEYLGLDPVGMTQRWRPWRTWVTVRDPGLDWLDDQGRNYLEHMHAAIIEAQ
jgi:hypothetical protein